MTEWGVVGVVIALLGLLGTVGAPVLKLNTSITKLTLFLDNLKGSFEKEQEENKQAHSRIWEKVDQNSKRVMEYSYKLDDHGARIERLEEKEK